MTRRAAALALLCPLTGCLGGPAARNVPAVPVVPTTQTVTDFAEFPRAPGTYVGQTPARVEPPPAPPIAVARPAEPPTLASLVPDPPAVAALRAEHQNQPDAEEYLRGLPQPDRELVMRLLRTAVLVERANFATPGTRKIQQVADQLETAQATVANYAPLVLAQFLLVERVEGFARYTPVPRGHRYPARGVAELYVELHNARPAPIGPESGEFEVKFSWRLQLRRSPDGPVLRELSNTYTVPPTRTPVRDCYMVLPVPVPDQPGKYYVTVEVQDKNRPPNGFVVSNRTTLEVSGLRN